MHTVEQYVNGEFLVAAWFTDIQDAYEFANNIDGLVIPKGPQFEKLARRWVK